MGTHLLRLALLLTVLQYAAVLVAPTGVVPILMDELLTNGGRRYLKAQHSGKYLTGQEHHERSGVDVKAVQPGAANHFTFVQFSDHYVAIRAGNGRFLGHRSPIELMETIDYWELWTPVKNKDGSWSFKSYDTGYLSAASENGILKVVKLNENTEKWRLETWQQEPRMAELLANGGRYALKAPCKEQGYLTGPDDYAGTDVTKVGGSPSDAHHHWTLVQMSDTEVAIRSSNGKYLRHAPHDWIDLKDKPQAWEMWRPDKWRAGLWGFKSRFDNGWLSSHYEKWAVGASDHSKCETWQLEPWQPSDTLMAELLAGHGRRVLESCEGKYLTGEGEEVDAKGGPTGDTKHWTMVQLSDTEVALRASNGRFLGHHNDIDLRDEVGYWERWTPVKNMDGSWSFKSRHDEDKKWLSAREGKVEVHDADHKCEKWRLHNW